MASAFLRSANNAAASTKAFSEATASGRVMSTKDAPVCCDTIIPYETGLLVPVQNAEKLADSLQWLIEHPPADLSGIIE